VKRIRITGGDLKGRSIEILERRIARYTPSKVREAIFNIIGSVEGKRILDVFAGSGSFTIEALSRGAASATCVERDHEMCALIRRNLESLSLSALCTIFPMEARRAIPFLYKKGFNYDIIFMDPPYDKGHVETTTSLFRKEVNYGTNTLLVIEHSKREVYDASGPGGQERVSTKRYGDTCITMVNLQRDLTLKGVSDET
jgi:16S rRNA (guanine966-N2)-methyltransferase